MGVERAAMVDAIEEVLILRAFRGCLCCVALFIFTLGGTDCFGQQPAATAAPGHTVTTVGHDAGTQRLYSGYYTAERVSNLRNNSDRHAWARLRKEAALRKAAYWVGIADDSLWAMVPGQNLPRCIDVTFDRLTTGPKSLGCLRCGEGIRRFGNYPYEPDFLNKPWKLTCPSCHAVFPTNDFAKYYASAIDEHGLFDPAKGDRRLLFNEAHPDARDPLHKFGVDDGFGYVDENGRGHRFVGYYSWKYWTYLIDGLTALSDAFLYSGEKRYAHKAAILLDRIADVYPDMDWKPYADRGWYHSDGGTHLGKIEGSIWETVVVQRLADAYAKIISGTVDSPQLFDFLRTKGHRYSLPTEKGTRERFLRSVDDRILQTAFDAVLNSQIRGNEGMHQLTVAMCAIALNTEPKTSEWLQWLFDAEGGAIPGLMISQLDRDGTSDEGAPAYAVMWGRLITQLASWLSSYPAYTRNNLFADYPQLGETFLAAYRMAAFGVAIPNIGDSGSTGLVTGNLVDPEFMAWGFHYTGNAEIGIAAYRANGNSADGLALDIFSSDPDATSRNIEKLVSVAGVYQEKGRVMSGFGLALPELFAGSHGVALSVSYGRTIKHGHRDMLNFDLFAFGHWLAPDHGYPEFATRLPTNEEWTGSTISHNTVFVDQKPQQEVWGGQVRRFKQLKDFGMVELDGLRAYPKLKEYARTMFLVGDAHSYGNTTNAYVIDVFRVNGGDDHVYSFHGPPGEVAHPDLSLEVQEGGTYAGKGTTKGAWSKDFPIGYSHLYNVRKDSTPPANFVLDWKAAPGYRGLKGDVHLRLHVANQFDDVGLADGDPPQNKPGNPERLAYALLHRTGRDINSAYVAVFEPYRNQPFIKSVTRLDDGRSGYVALRIALRNGGVDYFVQNFSPGKFVYPAKGMRFDGSSALVKERRGKTVSALIIDGTALAFRNVKVHSAAPFEGRVVAMNKELKGGGWIVVDQKLPSDGSLVGEQIVIDPSGERDACYTIRGTIPEGDHTRIYCGPVSFVRGYRGEQVRLRNAMVPKDYDQGYLYDFEVGASFRISNHMEWTAKDRGAKSK